MHSTTRNISVHGLDMNITDCGEGKPALVFLHYWGGSHRTWTPVIARLSDRYRCIAPDLRGWGEFGKRVADCSLEQQARDVEAVIETMGVSRYVLVGHSMGGKIAQMIAAGRPAGLDALILVAPAPPTPLLVSDEEREMRARIYTSREGVEQVLAILTERSLPEELREQVIKDTLNGSSAAVQAWLDHGMQLDISHRVRSIQVPVTVIVGDADKVENETTLRHELGKCIPEARFEILPGVGHLSPLEAPHELEAAISSVLDPLLDRRNPAA
ncbi:alpha/beta fold hydrolase [Pseudacidobacterium ailaaui]|jgi:pimeloyl-ACP methyl ester carboxylesterase|uniref:alpha/beta fold hydrolase n=1 Tax=Pseudacidobacterium ailaaui TaxID=1382359 RepID=UPI0005D167B6|nr:alpha/beta hydrolase [Pseudacidobacterium ailaaui]